MIEEYDFDDPKTRRSLGLKTLPFKRLNTLVADVSRRVRAAPLKAVNATLSAVTIGAMAYLVSELTPIASRPAPFIHQGVEISAALPGSDARIPRLRMRSIERAIGYVVEELDKYPDGFLADVCDLERIVVDERPYGSKFAGHYLPEDREIWILPNRELSASDFRSEMELVTVHEADHACSMTNRTSDDVAAWEEYVVRPGVPISLEVSRLYEYTDVAPPVGFARWYGATTANAQGRFAHIEDEATIKELITYGWSTIDARDDPLLDAKVELLIDRYTDWSGGVMDEDYFRSWSEEGFSYANRSAFLGSEEARGEERKPLDEHADER